MWPFLNFSHFNFVFFYKEKGKIRRLKTKFHPYIEKMYNEVFNNFLLSYLYYFN